MKLKALLLLLLCLPSCTLAPILSHPRVISYYASESRSEFSSFIDSVCKVSVGSENGSLGNASAVLVADITGSDQIRYSQLHKDKPYTYVFLTAGHFIDRIVPGTFIKLILPVYNGLGHVLQFEEVDNSWTTSYSNNKDVGWFVLCTDKPIGLKPCRMATSEDSLTITRGEKLFTLGCPSGLFPVLRSTLFMCRYLRNSEVTTEVCLVNSSVDFGHSGGGVFNTNGELVGILSMTVQGAHCGLFVPIDIIQAELARSDELAALFSLPRTASF